MAQPTRPQPTRSDDGTPRPPRPGLAASTATVSRPCGPATEVARGSAMALPRSNASWPNGRARPSCEQDGTATWSLSLLQRALRHAPDGLPEISTFTIWRSLHEAGLSWQKSRTWCETGVAMRHRKHGAVRVSDPDALAKKADRAGLHAGRTGWAAGLV